MKSKCLYAVLLTAVVLALAAPAPAHEYISGEEDHPLRYVVYLIHPAGVALEYGVARPVHWVVSRPYARVIFGHDPRYQFRFLGEYPEYEVIEVPLPVDYYFARESE